MFRDLLIFAGGALIGAAAGAAVTYFVSNVVNENFREAKDILTTLNDNSDELDYYIWCALIELEKEGKITINDRSILGDIEEQKMIA